ncbi:MAG TPA: PKD domain-containing protein [Hanamia sp.]|nr:PKD domain-containing protein [Hanamia sp.]
MKKSLLAILVLLAVFKCQAHHIIGGEMFYNYLGKGTAPNTSKYLITLKIFRDQNAPPGTAPMPTEVYIGIFNNDNGQQYPGPYPYYIVQKNDELPVTVDPLPPCINNAPNLSYHVGIFLLTVELPDNAKGYTASFQTCCRVDNISNVMNFNGIETGSTFSCNIAPAIYKDNSPEFTTSIDVICGGKPFTLKFDATDADGDSLAYSFAEAYDGGERRDAQNANPDPPPYNSVIYDNGFTANTPLGLQATIDSHTGIISGIAPAVGKYVLGVKVLSYRNGVLINDHRKDFIINVSDCNFAGAQLNPKPVICDSFNVAFTNDNTSPLNKTFLWDFGDPSTGNLDTSSLQSPTHVYSDTGVYVYKLVVNPGEQCRDSTTQIVKVYPGFSPAFNTDGECINSSIFFIDRTTTRYGSVSGWSWNFGDPSNSSDTSDLKNPSYVYTTPGNYPVELTATSSKGCLKTITDTVPIKAKPDFKVNNDTLICNIDTIQLTSIGTGTVSWTPNYNINNQHSFTPLVSPDVPTTYFATLVESRGCSATDSVFVNVVSRVSLNLPPDTTICLTDTITINTVSDGLHYLWSPAATIINDTAKYPQVVPDANTTYHVVSSIGKCNTAANITVKAVPYPKADAGRDTAICFPNRIQLHATGGSIYSWSPVNFLNNPDIANPVSSPEESIQYIVKVNDVLGCPKSTYDSVTVMVEKPIADAGPRDTSVVVNQPLQLNGTGAEFYFWSPATGLNNPDISNPVALLSESQQYVLQVQTASGCASTDTINVTVYKVKPDLYVPDAFTPNGDGKNDIFRPIPVGMKSLTFFKVYNRLGQLVYATNVINQGWDGNFKGAPQDPGVFVWMAQGVDYLGKTIFKKGSVILIR